MKQDSFINQEGALIFSPLFSSTTQEVGEPKKERKQFRSSIDAEANIHVGEDLKQLLREHRARRHGLYKMYIR